jgi:hypothetical protein
MRAIEADERRVKLWAEAIELRADLSADLKIKLVNAEKLYSFLGRNNPVSRTSVLHKLQKKYATVPVIIDMLEQIADRWQRNKSWNAIKPGDVEAIEKLLHCATQIRANQDDLDYRTFLVRHGLATKFIEQNMARLIKLLKAFDEHPFVQGEDILNVYNLTKIRQPLLMRGELYCRGENLLSGFDYVGFNPQQIIDRGVSVARATKHVLMIENMVPFVRFCGTESDANSLILYTGGFPSRLALRAIHTLVKQLPENVPVYYWGDIDGPGVAIFEHVREYFSQAGRTVQAVAMSREILLEFGTPDGWAPVKANANWSLGELAASIETSRITVEQEALPLTLVRSLLSD